MKKLILKVLCVMIAVVLLVSAQCASAQECNTYNTDHFSFIVPAGWGIELKESTISLSAPEGNLLEGITMTIMEVPVSSFLTEEEAGEINGELTDELRVYIYGRLMNSLGTLKYYDFLMLNEVDLVMPFIVDMNGLNIAGLIYAKEDSVLLVLATDIKENDQNLIYNVIYEQFYKIWYTDAGKNDTTVLTHEEFDSLENGVMVTLETYVQSVEDIDDGAVSVRTKSDDGEYYIYKMLCDESQLQYLTENQKIIVRGIKNEIEGETAVTEAEYYISFMSEYMTYE